MRDATTKQCSGTQPSGKEIDLKSEILKRVDTSPQHVIPELLELLQTKCKVSADEARNMIIYSQQSVISELHSKIATLLEMKSAERPAQLNCDDFQQNVSIPVRDLVALETNLRNVACNSLQPVNLNPLVVLQSNENGPNNVSMPSNYFNAIEPHTMQQVVIIAPTITTPVLRGPIKLCNPQVESACPVGEDELDALGRGDDCMMTRGAGMDSNDVNIITKQYSDCPQPVDDSSMLEELELFAKSFRAKRIKLGFTQGDVGLSLGKMYGSDFSQTTISRFEALNLSFKNMINLKPFLEKWIVDAERHRTLTSHELSNLSTEDQSKLSSASATAAYNPSFDPLNYRRRKRRCTVDAHTKKALEQYFLDKPHPLRHEVNSLAESLGQDRETIRIWFSNRRQKERKNENSLHSTSNCFSNNLIHDGNCNSTQFEEHNRTS